MKYIHPVIRNIIDRESCRQFKPDKVEQEDIELLLLAGSYAPCAGGRQPWAFSVITDDEILNLFADESEREFLKMQEMAARGLLPSAEESLERRVGDYHRGGTICGREGFPPLMILISEEPERTPDAACYLAAENIMLAAKAVGLDSLLMGAINANVIRPLVEDVNQPNSIRQLIPDGHKLVCTVGVGYADWNAFRAPRLPRRTDNVFYF